jgi:hypothetical protein
MRKHLIPFHVTRPSAAVSIGFRSASAQLFCFVMDAYSLLESAMEILLFIRRDFVGPPCSLRSMAGMLRYFAAAEADLPSRMSMACSTTGASFLKSSMRVTKVE